MTCDFNKRNSFSIPRKEIFAKKIKDAVIFDCMDMLVIKIMTVVHLFVLAKTRKNEMKAV